MTTDGYTYLVSLSAAAMLAQVALAFLALFAMLRLFDRITFTRRGLDPWREISAGNRAVGQYMGLRFLGGCILLGLMLGRSLI